MLEIKEKKECCGCMACETVCKHNAITFETDNEGFWYPIINKEKCIDCGLCEKVCPIFYYKDIPKYPPYTQSIYAAITKDDALYLQSTSGGIFGTLAQYVIGMQGIVLGARYNKKFEVYHDKAETLEECKAFMGSKYTQSALNRLSSHQQSVYQFVKHELNNNRKVLYTGTPCQIAALKLYLHKDYDNLITCDIICHGVPSPRIFADYIELLGGYKKIFRINLRSKINT